MKYVSTVLCSCALVAAHGYVDTANIGGQDYKLYQPYQDPYTNPPPQRIERPIQGNGPVEDVSIADIQCGGYSAGGVVGSKPAPLEATAAAGSKVILRWTLWPESHIGPTVTYMAKCPGNNCTSYMPGENAVWFKIAEDGKRADSTWGVTPLTIANNAGYTYTIPACLQAGSYIVRHELIALHNAAQYPGPQFYPSCHQIKVTGGGSTNPSGLVSFPGAYTGRDAIYDGKTYKVPGPAVFQC